MRHGAYIVIGEVTVLMFKIKLILLNERVPLVLFSEQDAFAHDVVIANM